MEASTPVNTDCSARTGRGLDIQLPMNAPGRRSRSLRESLTPEYHFLRTLLDQHRKLPSRPSRDNVTSIETRRVCRVRDCQSGLRLRAVSLFAVVYIGQSQRISHDRLSVFLLIEYLNRTRRSFGNFPLRIPTKQAG